MPPRPSALPTLATRAERYLVRLRTSEVAPTLLAGLGFDVPGWTARLQELAAEAWRLDARLRLARDAHVVALGEGRDLAEVAFAASTALRGLLQSAVVVLGTPAAAVAAARVVGQLRSHSPRFEGALRDYRGLVSELTIGRDDLAGGFGHHDVHGEAEAHLATLEAHATKQVDLEEAWRNARADATRHAAALDEATRDFRTAWRAAQRVAKGTLADL